MSEQRGFPKGQEQIEVFETQVIKRLSVSNLFKAVLQAFNLERGGVFTIKQLFINPGQLVLDYIGAGRLKYTAPFKLMVITTTLAVLAFQSSASFAEFKDGFFVGIDNEKAIDAIVTFSKYFNLLIWLYVPIAAGITMLFNRKSDYNYAEHLVYQAFLLCITNIITLLFIADHFVNSAFLSAFLTFAFLFYFAYSYKVLFNKTWWRSILEQVLIYLLGSFAFALVLAVLFLLYAKIFVVGA